MFTPIISGMSFSDILVYFLLYAIVGYMLEVIYAALVLGKFVNRGFLNGPWCPIYGFGMVIVAITLRPLSSSLIILFIGSVIVTSLIEFVTGCVLEKVFHQKWWDYTDEPFNLGGYICLKFSLIWGVACVFVVKLVLPFTDMLCKLLRNTVGLIVIFTLLGLLLADLAATVVTIAGIKKKMRLMDSIAAKLKENSNNVGGFLSEETLELKQRFDQLSEQLTEKGGAKRVLNAFPNLKKTSSKKLSELRESINESIEKSREKSREARERSRESLAEVREKSRENLAEARVNLTEAYENLERRVAEIKPKLAITKEDIPHIVVTLIIGLAIGYFLAKLI